jgi:hypothetical protein
MAPNREKLLLRQSKLHYYRKSQEKYINKTTLKARNTTAKATFKSGADVWDLEKREHKTSEFAQMRFLRTLQAKARLGHVGTIAIRRKLNVLN